MVWFRRLRRESAGIRKFLLQFKPNATREDDVAKRKKSKGRSAKHTGRTSPYVKYNKSPYQYSANYWSWRNSVGARGKAH